MWVRLPPRAPFLSNVYAGIEKLTVILVFSFVDQTTVSFDLFGTYQIGLLGSGSEQP
jgi:hypothetical protein